MREDFYKTTSVLSDFAIVGSESTMKIDKIISLANRKVRLPFLVMERSLRAVGCDLPLLVIPYDDDLFKLPPNAEWWGSRKFSDWLQRKHGHRMMAKYLCLTEENYSYFDTDLMILEDFRSILTDHHELRGRRHRMEQAMVQHHSGVRCNPLTAQQLVQTENLQCRAFFLRPALVH